MITRFWKDMEKSKKKSVAETATCQCAIHLFIAQQQNLPHSIGGAMYLLMQLNLSALLWLKVANEM